MQRTKYLSPHCVTPHHMEMFKLAWNNVYRARSGIFLYQCDISNTVNSHYRTQIQSITLMWTFFLWKPYVGYLHWTVKVTPSHWELPALTAWGCGHALSEGFHYSTKSYFNVAHNESCMKKMLHYARLKSWDCNPLSNTAGRGRRCYFSFRADMCYSFCRNKQECL